VEDQLDEKLLATLSKVSRGDLGPIAAMMGGILAQEVIKASSGKYTPIRQWTFFDAREMLPEGTLDKSDFVEDGTRYDGQVAVFGKKFQEHLMNLRYFLVGSGAIGCEMLKNWACMGMGCGPKGHVTVTDNDIIEISNLNRQFLYRSWDVSHSKSETASKAVIGMNGAMKIKAFTTKVCPETEDVFDDNFWSSMDGVCNALDNIHARLYVDSKCVFFGKSLLESGTLGTKGNTQVMVPHVSQTYGETRDPEPKETAKCLLHSFPSNVEHCLQWSRELLFEGEFVVNPEEATSYLKNPKYLDEVTDDDRRKKLDILSNMLIKRQSSLKECAEWARDLFEEYYVRRPLQLVHTFPPDAKDSAGQPFWQGTRRPPKATPFDASNEMHCNFIVSSAFLRAYTTGIIASEFKPDDLSTKRKELIDAAAAYKVPEWKPKDDVKIVYDPEKEEEDKGHGGDVDEAWIADTISKLPKPADMAGVEMRPLDFEKDDDANFHIDFVYSAANLRAVAYEIPTVSRLQAKLIAGKIIPAIVTTTAAMAGLVCIELYKLAQGKTNLEQFKNSYANLAIPVFNMADAVPPASYKYKDKKFTTWDSVKINEGDMTVRQLVDLLKSKFDINPYTIGYPLKTGVKNIWMSFGDYQREESMLVSDLVKELLATEKMELHPLQRCVKLFITPDTDDDDDDFMDVSPDGGDEEQDQFPPLWFYFR